MRTIWRRSPRTLVAVVISIAAVLAASVMGGCEVTGERPVDAPPVPPLVVGLLLPLSGEHAILGHSMLDAARMALEKHSEGQIEILPQDTEGTPDGARQAARGALDAGARLLVGPVFRGNAAAVVPLARRAEVAIITFSNDRTLSAPGVFVFGLGPEQKIARLADLAREKGIDAVGLLAPESAYSRLILDLMKQEERAGRFTVSDVVLYPPRTSFPALAPLVATLRHDWRGDGDPGALIVPMDGNYLAAVAQMLRNESEPLQIVSLDLDEPVFNPLGDLDGIWYVFPAGDRARKRFVRRSIKALGRRPGWMELMAYDAVAVIAERAAAAESPVSPVHMTEARAYAGVTGLFRFAPGGYVERALAVKAVGKKRPAIVSPAPADVAPRAASVVFTVPTAKPDAVPATGGTRPAGATGGL